MAQAAAPGLPVPAGSNPSRSPARRRGGYGERGAAVPHEPQPSPLPLPAAAAVAVAVACGRSSGPTDAAAAAAAAAAASARDCRHPAPGQKRRLGCSAVRRPAAASESESLPGRVRGCRSLKLHWLAAGNGRGPGRSASASP